MSVTLAYKTVCTGCCVCHDICPTNSIEMVVNTEGFLYPVIDNHTCLSCGKCQEVCPVINDSVENKFIFKKAYAAWNLNKKERVSSSSGGLFKVFNDTILADSGCVIGAGFDKNFHLKHSLSINLEQSRLFLGSKYLQSDSCEIYRETREVLKKGKRVLFTGLPCQIDALNHFLSEKEKENLITCELLCHGVASPKIFEEYILYLEKKHKQKIIEYNFRSKANGWNKMSIEVTYSNEKHRIYRARYCPYHTWFGKHLSLRNSCFDCKYRVKKRGADITIGDFWGIERLKPEITCSEGVSLLFVNNIKGTNFIKECSSNLFLEEVNVDKVLDFRKTILNNFSKPSEREIFMKDYNELGIEGLIKKYPASNLFYTFISKIKSMLEKMNG